MRGVAPVGSVASLGVLILSLVPFAIHGPCARAELLEVPGHSQPFVVERQGDAWTLWQGDQLRWRGTGKIPAILNTPVDGERVDTLLQIAAWQVTGDIFTGGRLQVRDLNGNGTADLVTSNWRYTTYAYEAVGDDQFQQTYQLANPVGSYYTRLLCAGDGDADGLAELVYGSGTSGVPRSLYFVESRQAGLYPDSLVLSLPEQDIGVNYMRVADLDGDGLREYIGSTQGTHDQSVAIWENRGDNSYARVFATHFGPAWTVTGETAVGDFDGDGRGDLVVPENGDVRILHILESTGNDAYAEVWSAVVPTDNMYWVTPGPDLDNDGRGDFVVTGAYSTMYATTWSFLMYEAAADNTYELVWSYDLLGGVIDGGSATGDIDGDGLPELLCQIPNRTMLFRATGDNTLELSWEHVGRVIGQGDHRLIAPDLDGDLKGEAIWWTSDNPGTLVIYERTGAPVSGVDPAAEGSHAQTAISLYSAPNPSRRATQLCYFLPRSADVSVEVYDVLGRCVATLFKGWQPTGEHRLAWRAGSHCRGVYSCYLRVDGVAITRKILLLE